LVMSASPIGAVCRASTCLSATAASQCARIQRFDRSQDPESRPDPPYPSRHHASRGESPSRRPIVRDSVFRPQLLQFALVNRADGAARLITYVPSAAAAVGRLSRKPISRVKRLAAQHDLLVDCDVHSGIFKKHEAQLQVNEHSGPRQLTYHARTGGRMMVSAGLFLREPDTSRTRSASGRARRSQTMAREA
jgi:hypothetical protein